MLFRSQSDSSSEKEAQEAQKATTNFDFKSLALNMQEINNISNTLVTELSSIPGIDPAILYKLSGAINAVNQITNQVSSTIELINTIKTSPQYDDVNLISLDQILSLIPMPTIPRLPF